MQANSAVTSAKPKANPKPSRSNSSLVLQVSPVGSNREPLDNNSSSNNSSLAHHSLVAPNQELPKVLVYLANHKLSPLPSLADYSVNHKRNRSNPSSQVHYSVPPQVDKSNQVYSSLVYSNQVVFLGIPTQLLDRHPSHSHSQVNQPLVACSAHPRLDNRVLLNQEQIQVHHFLDPNQLSQDCSNSHLAAVADYLAKIRPSPPPLVYSKRHPNSLAPLVSNHSKR